jgi:GNAT superfamily N-acetyltransferase
MNYQLIRDEGHRNPMTRHELQSRMEQWLAGDYQAIVIEDDAGAAGYALFRRDEEGVYLRQFFIQPDRRRQGIGRAAIAWLLENAWQNDRRVRLEVLIGNRVAIDFWRALGFADYCLTLERRR